MEDARVVLLLGVGGVGKTTLIFRLLDVRADPNATPVVGVYKLFLSEGPDIIIIDVPGQKVHEIVERVVPLWDFPLDLVIYMFDMSDPLTARELLELKRALDGIGVPKYKRAILIGNKLDVSEEIGVSLDPEELGRELSVDRVYQLSLIREDPVRILNIILENLKQ